jgi:hypothetical protein
MSVKVSFFIHNSNPDTIWNRLAARLGREPTTAEAKAEVRRILTGVQCDLAAEGRLPHQRKR